MSASDVIERVRSQFMERASQLHGDEPGWLSLVRKNAFERFLDKGFPTTQDEDWRFTSVAPLSSASFSLSAGGAQGDAARLRESLGLSALANLECHELVFVNGTFAPALSSPGRLQDGVTVSSLARALTEDPSRVEPVLSRSGSDETPFFDLNEAFVSDGAFVHVAKGVAVDLPVHLLFLTTSSEPTVTHPRNIVIAEPSSEVRIIETYAGVADTAYWTNVVTEVLASEDAVVDHYKLQLEGAQAFHVASLDFAHGRSATVSNHSLSLGARLARHDIRAELGGEGADVTLNGLYVVKGRQHVDHHTVIDHLVPHGTSRELYKGVLDGDASGVFNGRVIVRPDAQKTDSQQSNRNLLLSDGALVNTNPQLEINADDVKCAHGATIGQLDPDMMFYLRSRGIGPDQARRILTEGFMADVSERIRVAALRETLNRLLFVEAA